MKTAKELLGKYWLLFFFVSTPIFFTSCDDASSPNLNLFSTADEVALGQQLDAEITANPSEYPILNNASANQYLKAMLDEILASRDIVYREKFHYQIKIINTNTINAFAAPGGYLYVYKGLLQFLDNEATLAAVIAHEVAHAERRHATKRMTKQYGVTVLLSLVLGNNPSVFEEIATNLLTGLAFLKNSRNDEYEADEYSFKYLQATRWYPGATKFFFEKISANQSGGTLETLLSTHPLPPDRIKAVDELIKKHNIAAPTETNLFTDRYNTFKNSLP